MNKKELEVYINRCLTTGADFAEIFIEETIHKNYKLVDSKLKDIKIDACKGVGVRIALDNKVVYGSTSRVDDFGINSLIDSLKQNFSSLVKINNVKLKEIDVKDINKVEYDFDGWDDNKKSNYLKNIDKIAREEKLVNQVDAMFLETKRNICVCNSYGKLARSTNHNLRLFVSVYVDNGEAKESYNLSVGGCSSYELFCNYDIEKEIKDTVNKAVLKLSAKNFVGGELPVILGPGFGAVIFHEACGHGLEATSVSINESVFTGKMGEKIASEKVTLIDDGTINNCWGSNSIDDEGNATKKNILIEKGILKNYLIDELNSRRMNMPSNGCSRRECYYYMPTSRMSNTYLSPGTDKISDMVKSISLGVYCTNMGGGSVNPITGDFNFSVDDAYLIENGKITDHIKGISLIGNSRDILMNVEMVSDDLELSCGMCGSLSGSVPVTVGQPTIKISKILVGGRK